MNNKLYLSDNKKLLGVCGGIAEYFNIDPNIVRVAWIVFGLMYGSGILAYIVCAFIIPRRQDLF